MDLTCTAARTSSVRSYSWPRADSALASAAASREALQADRQNEGRGTQTACQSVHGKDDLAAGCAGKPSARKLADATPRLNYARANPYRCCREPPTASRRLPTCASRCVPQRSRAA